MEGHLMTVSMANFYGGAIWRDISSNTFLNIAHRVQSLNPTTGGLTAYLPNALKLKPGHTFWILNESGTNSVTLADNIGTTLVVAPSMTGALFTLSANTSQPGVWGIIGASAIGVGTGSSGGQGQTWQVNVTQDAVDFDLFAETQALGWNGTDVDTVICTIATGVSIGSSSSSTPAFLISSSFPSGMSIQLVNNGNIDGAGGAGGDGASTTTGNGSAGASGGTALDVDVAASLDNTNGNIRGGGGGGGGSGGHPFVVGLGSSSGGGGGGGQARGDGVPGVTYGSGGSGTSNYAEAGYGTPSGPGAGGVGGSTSNPSPTITGGTGGTWGQSGNAGESHSGATPTTGGAGGSGGLAIVGYSNLTVIAAGTITGGTSG